MVTQLPQEVDEKVLTNQQTNRDDQPQMGELFNRHSYDSKKSRRSIMAIDSVLNFYVPLPQTIYKKLREEAQRSRQPETVIARDAIDNWLKQRERETLHKQIAAYAKAHAGSEVDLDEELVLASIEYLLALENDL